MDSPDSSEPANTSGETANPEDSPVFRFMGSLSPLPPGRAPLFLSFFEETNFPPSVFESLEPKPRLAFLKSKQVSTLSVAELPGSNGDGKNTRLEEGSYSSRPVDDLIKTPKGPLQQSLVDIVNMASVDPNFSFSSTIEKPEYSDRPPDAGSKEILVKPESKNNTRISEEIVVVPPVIARQVEENIVPGKSTLLDDCSCLSSRPIQVGNENENFLDFTEAALTEPVQKKVHNDPEAFQYSGQRRRLLFEDAEHEIIPNQPARNPSDIEVPESLSVEIPEMLINRKLDEIIQPMFYPRNGSNATTKVPKPSLDERECTEKDGYLEEFNVPSPKIEWTKSLDSSEGNCSTGCNCRRSKCLKLLCQCFAPAMYCAETCTCEKCSNRPEYKDEVCETRGKIEFWDPLAFAPQVVKDTIELPASSRRDDGTCFTPTSARHKRGCRCKKVKCQKKCCECFEAHVGCSDKCLCTQCKNSFGQKKARSDFRPPHLMNSFDQESHHHSTKESTSLSGGPNLQEHVDNSNAHSLISSVTRVAQFGGTEVFRGLKFDGELSNTVQDDIPRDIEEHF